ncbi:MAG: DUF3853 family protein [Bacteroidales bacterium]|nr:DUF3853 family protein [Bacteroidales bacterium]
MKGVVMLNGRKFEPVVYGLEGIMQLFGVSKTTAHRYKSTFLKDAITQHGNVIVVDTLEALRLFGIRNPEGLIKQPTVSK